MVDEKLLTFVSDIVAAHVGNNDVKSDDLPGLIQAVYESLATVGRESEPAKVVFRPAVPIRSSVKADSITCLECGQQMKMLKRHIGSDHGLTPADYRVRYNLLADYPMVAPEYAAKRKELALKIGLGRKPGEKLSKRSTKAAEPVARKSRKKDGSKAPVQNN